MRLLIFFVSVIFLLPLGAVSAGDAGDLYIMAEAEDDLAKKEEILKRIQGDYGGTIWAARSHLDLGEIYLLKGDSASAVREFSAIRQSYKDAPFMGRALYLLALSRIASDEKDEGIALLEKVVRDYPGSADAEAALRSLHLQGGDSPAMSGGVGYYLQVGVYSARNGAETYKKELNNAGLAAGIIAGEVYKVVLGPFGDDIEAQIYSENLRSEKGIDSFVIEHP